MSIRVAADRRAGSVRLAVAGAKPRRESPNIRCPLSGARGSGIRALHGANNNAVQFKLNLEAQKIAGMRAKDALCGLIIGDRASWTGSVVESMKDQVQEFEPLGRDDPLARSEPENVRKFDEARQSFVSRLESTDVYGGARRGILPPGVNTKAWFDADHAWAYGMSVYVPSLANAAARDGRDMRESKILQDIDEGTGAARPKASSPGFTDEKSTGARRPSKKVKPGPTGKIEPER